MEAAEQQTAEAVLNAAGEQCMQEGFNPQNIRREIRRGRPEQQIIGLAQDPNQNVGLVVIGSTYKRAPTIALGPASVGHVARFVVDHSPCDVLLLR
jgi:nucleotide-binding universal stress UspA family protein